MYETDCYVGIEQNKLYIYITKYNFRQLVVVEFVTRSRVLFYKKKKQTNKICEKKFSKNDENIDIILDNIIIN